MEASTQEPPALSLGTRMRIDRVRHAIADKPVRFIAGYIVFVIIFAGLLYSGLEAEASWVDGMWWAVVTASTVGYGDISPVEIEGRLLAGWVILSGIATTAMLTGLLAGWVMSAKFEEYLGTPDLDDDFDHLIGQLAALKQRYQYDEDADDRISEAARLALVEWQSKPEGEKCDQAMATLAEALKHDY